MRKFFGVGIGVICLAVTGCSSASQTYEAPVALVSAVADGNSFEILCSSYPVYEWTSAIVGDSPNIEVTLLMANGVDPHNYQASAQDIAKIHTTDLCIYIGGDSEYWIGDAVVSDSLSLMNALTDYVVEKAYSEGMEEDDCCAVAAELGEECDIDHSTEIVEDDCDLPCCEEVVEHSEDCDHDHDHDDCCEVVEVVEEEECELECCLEVVEIIEEEECELECCLEVEATVECELDDHSDCDHDHDHGIISSILSFFTGSTCELDHEHDENCGHDHEGQADEHIWLSAKLAMVACEIITDTIIELDPTNASIYSTNLEAYLTELMEIDDAFQAIVDDSEINTLIFGDRFPFVYLLTDYNIDYYAAFSGCSTDTEASFETIIFLTEQLNATDASAVCYVSETNRSIAEVIVNSSDDATQPLVQFTSMETITPAEREAGVSYLDLMWQNVDALAAALK